MVVLPTRFVTAVKTGKFCKLFGPVSASHPSLVVTPLPSKSMPSALLEKIELARIALFAGRDAHAGQPVERDGVAGAGVGGADEVHRTAGDEHAVAAVAERGQGVE